MSFESLVFVDSKSKYTLTHVKFLQLTKCRKAYVHEFHSFDESALIIPNNTFCAEDSVIVRVISFQGRVLEGRLQGWELHSVQKLCVIQALLPCTASNIELQETIAGYACSNKVN